MSYLELARQAEARLKRAQHPFEVRVPWFAETIWFVATGADAEALVNKGVSRGRLWTLSEVRDFFGACGCPVSTLAEAVRVFEGTS